MTKILNRCDCVQSPRLQEISERGTDAQWQCPYCKQKFWPTKDGGLSKEPPFAWAKKFDNNYEEFEIDEKTGRYKKTK